MMPSRFPNLLEVSEREALARKRDFLDDVTRRLAEEAFAVEYALRRTRGEGPAEAAEAALKDARVAGRKVQEIHQASCDKAEAAHREKWGL